MSLADKFRQDYQLLHGSSADNFTGKTILKHRQDLREICRTYKVKSLLDYGCGKAGGWRSKLLDQTRSHESSADEVFLADYLGVPTITLYDIGLPEFSGFPDCCHDLVVSIDVLEHVPIQNVDKVLADIFGFAKRYAFLTIASYPARKHLPDGRNAHVTIRSPAWWLKKTLPHVRRHGIPATLKIIESPHCGTLTGMNLGLRRFLGLPSRKTTIFSVSPNGSLQSIQRKFKQARKKS